MTRRHASVFFLGLAFFLGAAAGGLAADGAAPAWNQPLAIFSTMSCDHNSSICSRELETRMSGSTRRVLTRNGCRGRAEERTEARGTVNQDAHSLAAFYEDSAVPEREFTLTAFSLPEPVGIDWPKPTRWWLWGTVTGLGIIVLSVIAGRVVRRRQQARAAAQKAAAPSGIVRAALQP